MDVEEILTPRRFLAAPEAEWEEPLPYTDGRYGFAVVPRLSVVALDRYARTVGHTARGVRQVIRREVTDYLFHCALTGGESVSAMDPELWMEAVFGWLLPAMEPLVRALARGVAQAAKKKRCPDVGAGGAVEAELRLELRQVVSEYRPHSRLGRGWSGEPWGAIGQSRRSDVAGIAQRLGVSAPVTPVPLVLHVERGLRAYARKLVRVGAVAEEESEGRKVIGPDGTVYLTVAAAARRLECSVHQLRRLDAVTAPRRPREVYPGKLPREYRLMPRQTRLYPVEGSWRETADRELKRRRFHASRVPEGTKTRAAVARALDVRPAWLTARERSGALAVRGDGRNVLYNITAYRQARVLVAKMKAEKRRRIDKKERI